MLSGRKPKLHQRQQIERLRARGQSLATIGRQLGISRQAVHQVLRHPLSPRRPIVCCQCGATISPAGGSANMPKLLCRTCLALRPRTRFAQRLVSLRHSAGLTQAALAQATGIPVSTICQLERGKQSPQLRTRERLLAFLEPDRKAKP